MQLLGIETEYGIIREDVPDMDAVNESMALVRAYSESPFLPTWDYQHENPHKDLRGFCVPSLQQDHEETQYAEQDAHRGHSFQETKSDLVLSNGARFYNDHTHPEYSTPECRSLIDIVAHDRAGEWIVQQAADKRNQTISGAPLQLYKNNTDFHGHSYGCHDNYLLPRSLSFEQLAEGLLPFLVSRQLFSGAGKVGREGQDIPYQQGPFQLSQRADFIETTLSVDTMHNRPIVNTRDEPHADRTRYRRLHLIVGDANMCEYATALKVGTTQLVLDMIKQGAAPELKLDNPVEAIKIFSQDTQLKAVVGRNRNGTISGLDLQSAYLSVAQRMFAGVDEETDWILQEWAHVLDCLQRDRLALIGYVDWITKQWLLETFREEENLPWTAPWLASLDLEYHNLHPDRGLFRGLEAEGKTYRLCPNNLVEAAMHTGPSDTRGGIRGWCVQRFGPQITAIQWEHIHFKDRGSSVVLDLSHVLEPEDVQHVKQTLQQAQCPADFTQLLAGT
ncbi:MAG: peptidase [Nitrospirales bacterium]|nr:peptidase [Nitrospirales bacterium]